MSTIDIPTYFSQWDSDRGSYSGACVETCLKMVSAYLGKRVPTIAEIVNGGDGDGGFTDIAGAKKAALFCGFEIEAKNISPSLVSSYLNTGHLIIAAIIYGQIPKEYKQDLSWPGGHAVLITGITDSLSDYRYADPDFGIGGVGRDGGFLNNNKWIPAKYFNKAWSGQNYLGLIVKNTKEGNVADYSWFENPNNPDDPKTIMGSRIRPTLRSLKETAFLTKPSSEKIKVICDYANQVPALRKEIVDLKKQVSVGYIPVGTLYRKK